MCRAELVSTGKVYVVDCDNFNKPLKEMNFQARDWADSEKNIRLGAASGASVISRGQIINNPDASVGVVVLIRWLQSVLIPFVTTQGVGVLNPPHE